MFKRCPPLCAEVVIKITQLGACQMNAQLSALKSNVLWFRCNQLGACACHTTLSPHLSCQQRKQVNNIYFVQMPLQINYLDHQL